MGDGTDDVFGIEVEDQDARVVSDDTVDKVDRVSIYNPSLDDFLEGMRRRINICMAGSFESSSKTPHASIACGTVRTGAFFNSLTVAWTHGSG